MKIVPKPSKVDSLSGKTIFSANTDIISLIDILKDELFFLDFENATKNSAEFIIGETDYDYELTVDGNIKAVSRTEAGLFHAAMSLKQLLFEGYEDGVSTLENCVIKDKARFEYRGFMLDIVRHFFDKDVILQLLDMLALAKFSVFHMHLSDNQGYRLQSDIFPILNAKGHMRKGTRGDGKPVGGYLSKEDVKEIVEYAAKRYIEVIPEIDLPGHTVAMLAAMPEMSCTGEHVEVAERFGIDGRILCAGREENYLVLDKLIAEVAEMFPSRYFHLGGDEVPKFQWRECEKCNALMKKEGYTEYEQLQGYFTNRVVRMLKSLGKVPVAWNEALYSGMLDDDVVCQYWSDGMKADRVVAAAEKGRKVIVSKFRPYYVDYPYGMTSLKATYNYEPAELFGESGKKNIIGVETPLWTEYVDTVDKIYYQAFPRAFAVAESGWSDERKDYKDFVERLENVLGILQVYDHDSFADIKEAKPNFFKGTYKTVKFFLYLIDSSKEGRQSAKNAKDATKGRK